MLVAALAACSFRDNRATGDGSGSSDASSIDAPVDARLDGAPGSAKMKLISIKASKIAGALTAFPMWFVTDDPDLHAHATSTGTDIYFTKTDGAPLPFERQRWTSATGHLEAWILVDLDPAMTNAIQLRYGDPGPATNPNPRAVFANGFLSVW